MDNDELTEVSIDNKTNTPSPRDEADFIELASVIDAEKEVIQRAESKILEFAKQLIESNLGPEAKRELENEMLNIQSQVDQLRQSCSEKEQVLKEYLKEEDCSNREMDFHGISASDSKAHVPESTIRKADPTIRIQAVESDFAEDWNTYVLNHANSSIYHLFGWKSIAEKQLRADCLYLTAIDLNNNIVGVLPLISAKASRKFRFGTSLPFSACGGPLTDSESITKRLLWRASEIAQQQGWRHIEIKSTDTDLPWQSKPCQIQLTAKVKTAASAYSLDSQSEELREHLHNADFYKPSIRFGKNELLDLFYKAYSQQPGSTNKPFFKKAFFASAVQSFHDSIHFAVIQMDNRVIASAMLTSHEDTLEIPCLAISKKNPARHLEEWIYWQILQYAAENHYSQVDFGLQDPSRADTFFEKFWDAERSQQKLYYWVKPGCSFEQQAFFSKKPVLSGLFA